MENELKKYINENIKSKYKTFDKGHNVSHFMFVTRNCLNYGKQMIEKGFDVDLDIAYVVGAYHDVGIIYGRDNHAFHRGNLYEKIKSLQSFIQKKQLNLSRRLLKTILLIFQARQETFMEKLLPMPIETIRNIWCFQGQ